MFVLSCGALAASSFVVEPVTSCDAVLSTAHDDGSLQHLSRNRYGHGAVPPARITADQPVIAVALSEDSQQHWRLWHHSHPDFLRDGRIGYWYTNSRFARGAIASKASEGFPIFQFSNETRP
jgi:hypothetical protein